MTTSSPRQPAAPVAAQFIERWSPRAFTSEPVTPAELASVFEAARWSPSCFNEQPWLFVYGVGTEDHARVLDLLVEGNRSWANVAPVLGIAFAKRTFGQNGKPNRWAPFDTGAAALALALQARELGLYTHFMGGFDQARSYAALGVDETEYEAMAAFALGHRGERDVLPAALAEREQPSPRKPLAEVAVEGRLAK